MLGMGDRVVCVKTPTDAMYCRAGDYYGIDPPRLQVGQVYVINGFYQNPPFGLALMVSSIPDWYYDVDYFRKVTDIEEPKRVVTRKEVPQELEPV